LKKKILSIIVIFSIVLFVAPVFALKPPMTPPAKPEDHIWVNGEIYDTIILGDIKNPNPKSLDHLYVFFDDMGNEVPGQRPITDVAPGIPGYNGGRWAVFPVSVTDAGWAAHDPDMDGEFEIEITSFSQLMTHVNDLGHFEIADTAAKYFLCPLHKSK
jgi:hypothetical protein